VEERFWAAFSMEEKELVEDRSSVVINQIGKHLIWMIGEACCFSLHLAVERKTLRLALARRMQLAC